MYRVKKLTSTTIRPNELFSNKRKCVGPKLGLNPTTEEDTDGYWDGPVTSSLWEPVTLTRVFEKPAWFSVG